MPILKFERTAKGSFTVHNPISQDDAVTYAAIAVKAGDMNERTYADNFTVISDDRIPRGMEGKCFGGPFVLDERSVDIIGDARTENSTEAVFFDAMQNCLYFTNSKDLDHATCMASILAATDKVESLVEDVSEANRWTLKAPTGIPLEVIAECFAEQQIACVRSEQSARKASAVG